MAKNTPSPTTPLWWTFFHDSALDSRPDIVPVCRVYAPNPNRTTEKWDAAWSTYSAGTAAQKIAKRWADQIEYLIDTLGVTRNDQIAIQLHIASTDLFVLNAADGIDALTSDWEVNTVFSASGVAAISSAYGDPFAALETELTSRAVSLRPAFALFDIEDALSPRFFCGGNANGTFGNGNWDDQLAEARAATEVILTGNIAAAKGGGSDRTLSDLSLTAAGDIDADWRASGQVGFTRDAMALCDMVLESAISGLFYTQARATFTTSYTGGAPIKCGNYRITCGDHAVHPHRHRNDYAAPDGSRLPVYAAPAFVSDFYGDCQCPVLYPCRNFARESTASSEVMTNENFWQWTGFDSRSMVRNYWRSQIQAVKASSLYDADLTVPWMEWPNIGRGPELDATGTYANGDCYPHHTEDYEWLVARMLTCGIYRGFWWSWNPSTQAAADAATLTAMLDRAYARLGHTGGVT